MNEKAWLSATRPRVLLEFLGDRVSDRKGRLLAVACVRRHWSVLTDPRSRRAVEVAEEYAEGLCSEEELSEAHAAASQVRSGEAEAYIYAALAAAEAARLPQPGNAEGWARKAAGLRSERVFQCGLIRDLMGNPFRSRVERVRPSDRDGAWGGSSCI